MKKIKIVIAGLVFGMLNFACTADFAQTNEDPNRIAQISPGTLLNPIIYGIATHNANRSASITFNLMQVSLPFPSVSGGIHRYDLSDDIGSSSWSTYYKWINNIKEMKQAAVKAQDGNYEAIALTLNALAYSSLTDLFGPVPMTEAVKGDEGILYPAFDSQERIYETILADLERANTLYNTAKPMIYYSDILFQNDITKWRKFTNSLRMRLLLRISNRTETNAFQKLATLVNNPTLYPVFESTAESAIFKVTGVTPNTSTWTRPQDFNLSLKMGSFFIDNLNTWADPRRPIIALTATNNSNVSIGYKGIPSAFAGPESQFNYNASTLNTNQVKNPMNIFLLTFAEVEFIKSELAQRGYFSDAAGHYKKGVQAAMEQLGAVFPTTYFANLSAAYDGTLERIMLQKYYALYFTDYQQWFEYRRTGFPVLPTTSAMLNSAVMPSRFLYPTAIQISNQKNYLKAVELLGADTINAKVWWDK